MNSDTNTTNLLKRLFLRNANDPDHGDQLASPPEDREDQITTLDGTKRYLSPMLSARFDFCSHWENANLDQNWLSLREIADVRNNETFKNWINLRIENWSHVPPASVDAASCAAFGFNPFEPDETYLTWDKDTVEPKIWRYFSSDYKLFNNFNRYLEYLVGDRNSDDAIR